MFTITQLKTMFAMQAELNSVMGKPTWLTDGNDYLRAARIELFEGIDHFGYKWWKATNPNLPQCQLELVDSWHFFMSEMLVNLNADGLEPADLISGLYEAFVECAAMPPAYNGDFNEAVDTVIANTYLTGNLALKPFIEACQIINLSGDQFFKMYVSKNTLNLFRQKHGDKQGTYIKTWFGREDNVFLAQEIAAINVTAPDFIEKLNASLEAEYAAVKANNTH
jgi:hypothetical protein